MVFSILINSLDSMSKNFIEISRFDAKFATERSNGGIIRKKKKEKRKKKKRNGSRKNAKKSQKSPPLSMIRFKR